MLRWNRLAAASRRGFGRSALASGLNVAILAALLPSGAFAAEVPSAYYEVLRQPVTSVDASFVSYAPPVGTQQVSVAIGGGDWFFLDAPDGVQLSVGTYVDAGSSVAPGHPRFDSFACDGPVRSFVVHEVSFNPDRSVATLAVDYDCPGSDQGSLRFHSTWPAQSISAPQIIDYIDVLRFRSQAEKHADAANKDAHTHHHQHRHGGHDDRRLRRQRFGGDRVVDPVGWL